MDPAASSSPPRSIRPWLMGTGMAVVLGGTIWIVSATTNGPTDPAAVAAPVAVATATDTDTVLPTVVTTPAPTVSLELHDWYAAHASGDTFSDVDNHPDAHVGDVVVWTCTVDKILGANASYPTATDIACDVDSGYIGGAYSSPLPQAVITTDPKTVNADAINPGDNITVSGYVVGSYSGVNGFGGTVVEPSILAVYVDDPNADTSVGGQS